MIYVNWIAVSIKQTRRWCMVDCFDGYDTPIYVWFYVSKWPLRFRRCESIWADA